MRILVTGGCGYVGAHVVRRIRAGGHHLVVLDDLSTGHPLATAGTELVRGDIRDAALVAPLVRRVDAVIHLAGLKDAAASVVDPASYFSVNVEGSRVLLEAARASGVRYFLFSSSCAVYGQPGDLPVRETSPLRPINPYGESKVMVERMLPWFEAAGGPMWVSLRYANAAGAHPGGDIGEATPVPSNLIPRVMAALTGRLGPVEIFGLDYDTPDGTAIRDYVHVVDIADAHARALAFLDDGGASTIVNVGTGRGASVREVLDTAARVSGREVPTTDAPRRPGDPPAIWAAVDRAREVLGWQPAHDLASTISSAWRWHSSHPDGYRSPESERRA